MIIRPIKTEEDYRAALTRIDSLAEAQIGTDDFDTLDVLITLVEVYETKHYPIGPPDPVAAIEYEMEKRGLTRQDLETVIGPSGRVSEILNRQRPLTVSMIRRLHLEYDLRPEVLIASYPLKTKAPIKTKAPSKTRLRT